MIDAALDYAKRGRPVFPCALDKKPLTTNGFKDATTNPEKVTAWWSANPTASIGIPTGGVSGIFVLDVDLPDGPASLAKLEEEHGCLPATLEQRTGSGGRHLLFQHPGFPIRNSASKLGKGLDIRGDGGYIVAPPSPHPSGEAYRWTNKQRLEPAPDWLLTLLKEPKPIQQPAATGISGQYGKRALATELAELSGTQQGGRNHRLNAAAYSLGQLVAGGELDRGQVVSALMAAAAGIGLTATEATKTIESGLAAGEREPRSAQVREVLPPRGRILEAPPTEEKPTQAMGGSKTAEVEQPLLFDENRTPDIPPSLFPSWLGEYIAAVARNTQTPPAMAGLLALSTVAAVVAKRFDVAPHGGGYSEPLNVWTQSALGAANRKTAVLSAVTAPVVEWERMEAERLAPEIRRIAAKRHALEKRREKLLKDTASADDQDRLDELLRKIERLEGEIPDELRAPRLWTGDTTPERLQSLLVDHGERMAVLTDEGGIFETMAGLYSGGAANLDIFLQGHAGRAVRVDRQGRTAHLDAPALTFGLAVQPDILADLASGSKRRFRGNGMLARFLFAVPRSNIGSRDVRAVHSIPPKVAQAYRDGLFGLLAIPPVIKEGREISRRLTLDPDALNCWYAFAEMIERRLGDGGDLEPIQDWSGKLPGAALRIAGIFHLVEYGGNPPTEIGAATIERALDLCALLIEHAGAAFGMMEGSAVTDDAKAIFRWIIDEKLSRFRKGVAYRQFKGRFTGKPDRFDKALQELEERAIISAAKEKTDGRAATVFIVNPALWSDQQ